MSAEWEPVLGATQATQINYGETINTTFSFTDGNGDPIDLTGATITCSESYPATLASDLDITISDAAGGIVTVYLADEDNDLLPGRVSWFRIRAEFSETSDDVTPRIWVQIT